MNKNCLLLPTSVTLDPINSRGGGATFSFGNLF